MTDTDSSEPGLRALKKGRTRRLIAETAARLFGERGYEQVTVAEVARAAEVSQQTLYNYFPTKESLVLDRDAEITEVLTGLIMRRPKGTSPAAALRSAALSEVERQRSRTQAEALGDLPVLSASSSTVRRLALEARDRQADSVATAIYDTSPIDDPLVAKVQATALLAVFQGIFDHVGRRRLDGVSSKRIVDEILPSVVAAFDDLERRFND